MSSSSSCPAKNDIQAIFKRLRSVQANKLCFDCHAKNPTWASVTYGIFICIDCSGIHRSLGVHLTFVRSTQLDSNWTWQQLRQMQLGGNANASTFFRQHNAVTNDAQQKYKSRAAQLYRDKLHTLANQAMRLHGTKLFIDNPQNAPGANPESAEAADQDFFASQESQLANLESAQDSEDDNTASSVSRKSASSSIPIKNGSSGANLAGAGADEAGPSVEAALSMSPTAALEKEKEKGQARKPTIGGRKPQAKKGLGAKKGGLGAQKVKKDFASIEREAELADQTRSRAAEEERAQKAKRPSAEDEEKAVASMRLAYQEMGVQQKKTEQKLRSVDPSKAAQVERLGMGVGAKSGAFSHSAITEMSSIQQEEPRSSSSAFSSSSSRNKYRNDFDDDDYGGGGGRFGGFDREDKYDNGRDSFSSKPTTSSDWEKEFEVLKTTKTGAGAGAGGSEWNNNFDDKPKRGGASDYSRPPARRSEVSSNGAEDAQKKFAGAKAISSDMFFDQDSRNGGSDANVNRFQGSNSISSAEYFGRDEGQRGGAGGAGGYGGGYGSSLNAPDMEDVKESVKQGVSKVAGRLSGMASGVMTQLQDKYGY